MLKPATAQLVHARLFPNPKPNDPVSFQAHVTRNLVPEVRQETQRFYGPGESLESQYPGLDYSNPSHRLRLVLFQWHRRLFRVFDELRLATSEIEALCRWEGTKYARLKYQRDNSTVIRDTTWDDVEFLEQKQATASSTELPQLRGGADDLMNHFSAEEQKAAVGNDENEAEDSDEDAPEEESEDELQQSIGVDLNRRLIAATEARARGEEVVMDEDWEQWLKEAAERSGNPFLYAGSSPSQDPADNPGSYGQIIPTIFTSNPTPQIQAVQAHLPPPPRYTDYVQGAATTPATGTAM